MEIIASTIVATPLNDLWFTNCIIMNKSTNYIILNKRVLIPEFLQRVHVLNHRQACHTPPLKNVKKQLEMPIPSLSPIPSLNFTFVNGMGLRLGNGISPCFFRVKYDRLSLNPFCFLEKIFCFLLHYKSVMSGF